MPIVAFDGKKCQYCGFSNERCECVCDDWTNYTTPSNICSQAIGSSILGLKFYVLSWKFRLAFQGFDIAFYLFY